MGFLGFTKANFRDVLHPKNKLVRIGQIASLLPFAIGGGAALAGGAGGSTAAGAGSAALPSAASGIGTTAGYGSLFGGSAAAGASSALSAVAPVITQTAAKSAMPWMRLGELGAGLFSNFMGNRSQGQANDREFAYRTAADERAYNTMTAQEAQRHEEWLAQQAMAEKSFQAQQEQARLDREEERRQNAIAESYAAANEGRNVARENQRVPYRQAGQIALRDLVSGLR